jgi:hypothetical protein
MSAADDRDRFEEVTTCLTRLADGGTYTRKGLFSHIQRWQRDFLKRLVASAAVNSEKRGSTLVYTMDDPKALDQLIINDQARIDLIFPRSATVAVPQQQVRFDFHDDSQKPSFATGPETGPGDDVIESAACTDRELLENMLKMTFYTVDRIAEVEARIEHMEQSVKALLPPLEKLLKEFLK